MVYDGIKIVNQGRFRSFCKKLIYTKTLDRKFYITSNLPVVFESLQTEYEDWTRSLELKRFNYIAKVTTFGAIVAGIVLRNVLLLAVQFERFF
jgi:hypothetical protein